MCRPFEHTDEMPFDQNWPAADHSVTSSPKSSSVHCEKNAGSATVFTDATNSPGLVGSGRATHGSRLAIATWNTSGVPVTVAENAKLQVHCSRSPGSTSAKLLDTTDPVPISWFVVPSRIRTGAPTSRPLVHVSPSPGPSHPLHVPSSLRTASLKLSVWSGPDTATVAGHCGAVDRCW